MMIVVNQHFVVVRDDVFPGVSATLEENKPSTTASMGLNACHGAVIKARAQM